MDRPDRISPWDRVPAEEPENVAQAVTSLVDWLADTEEERYRILDNRVLESLYAGRWVTSDDLMPGVAAYADAGGDPVKLNFAKNAVDFVHTKVCAETPAVVVSKRSGGYQTKRRAEALTRYVEELMESADSDSLLPVAALNALRTGTAVAKTHAIGGRPGIELVPAEWVFVDPTEARCGSPRSLYERRPVPRRYLLDEWAEEDDDAARIIEDAPSARDPLALGTVDARGTRSDMVDVYEAWSLPGTGPDAAPGRHVVCVRGGVLFDEEWSVPRFPHAFFHVVEPAVGRGFWGQGLLEQLDEAQAEIDFLLAQVAEQIRLSRLKIFVRADEPPKFLDHLRSSEQGNIVPYATVAPIASTMPTVSREALQHIDWLLSKLYETAGMSEQAASSQRPAGVNSGRAILFFHDFQTRRFVDLVKRYGRFVTDVVDRMLDRAEEAAASVGDEDSDGDEPLSWAKVRMDRSEYRLRLETISPVPQSYAGRMQRIEQLIAQGQVPEGYWSQYLSDPDAWRAEHRASCQADHIDWLLERLTDPDADDPPLSDKLDFEMAIEVLNGEVLDLIREGADREIVDRVEEFYDRIVARRDELAAAMAPPAPGPEGAAQSPTAPGLAPMGTGGLAPTPTT